MTDNDETNQDTNMYEDPALSQETLEDEGDDEFADEGGEAAEGELTPNDIFGLDPLDVLTLEELAEYLKVSPAAARRVMKEQNLPGRNIGGEWRFLRDAVANWLRGQEAPAAAQQAARTDYSKAKDTTGSAGQAETYSPPPRRPYQAEQSGGNEYGSQQRYSEGGQQQYGRQGGGQSGYRSGGYRAGGNQYGGNQYGGGSYGGGQSEGGDYSGGSYTRPPRRPFRSEGGGGNYSGGEGGGYSGYGAGSSGQFGGGGYSGGGQRFGGGPKRRNKRQVFENERGKRLDRRKEGGPPDGQE